METLPEVDVESELDGDCEHAVNLCDMHLISVPIGAIVESSCGVLVRYLPHKKKCQRCLYGSSHGPSCIVCGS